MLSSLTITQGKSDAGGGIYLLDSTLTLNNCTVIGNSTPGLGAGIVNSNGR